MSSTGVIEIGDLIDNRYRILEILGRGGMGTVYRAEHVGIRREVAIKIMHRELRGDDLINERLTREAFATARMDHPNCVSVTDSGSMPEGEPFLVMELLSGCSLGDELEARISLPIDEALHIAKEVLKGLEHAHSLGIVHRDLKPDNIFLVKQEDAFPQVKILDFGIVKLQGDAVSDIGGEDLTMVGMAIGSPVYMSPEQATGGEIDERTDIYSLALVLYEMLNGEPPFYERNDKLQSLKRRLYEDPPALVTADGHPISARLEAIIHHGLGLRAPDRISNASEFLVNLAGLDDELNSMPDAIKSTGMVDLVTGEHAAAVGGGIASTDAARQHQPSPVTPK
ncbi:MAG: serine/threonine protein kinase, partial [Kofleriaceae bacterium]|nr:serine/threonine protein kinase [Kofleriaceae bacterium]